MSAEKLILLTDVEGVLDREGKLFSTLTESEVMKLVENKTVSGGMIPTVTCCIDAVRAGVKETHVVDGRVPHAILLEIFTDSGVGTEIIGG